MEPKKPYYIAFPLGLKQRDETLDVTSSSDYLTSSSRA